MPDISCFKNMTVQVNAICSPLFKYFPVNYFRLLRIYKNGKRTMLCSNSDVLDLFYTDGWYKFAWLDGATPKIDKHLIAWQLEKISMDTEPEFEIGRLLSKLAIKEGIAFVHEFNDFFECYDIAGPSAELYNIDFSLLHRFCFYFRAKAANLLNNIYTQAINIPIDYNKKVNQQNVNPFISATPLSRYYFDSDSNYLTSREAECIYCRLSGLTAKETGKKLKISNRTVEAHLERARRKFDFLQHSKLLMSLKNG